MARDSNVTTSFSVDLGDFQRSLRQATNEIRQAEADFNLATSGMENWEDSANGVNAKIAQLTTTIEAQNRKIALYQNAINELNQATARARQEQERLTREYEQAKNTYGENSNEAKELQRQLVALQRQINNNENNVANYTREMTNLQASNERLGTSMEDLNSSSKKLEEGFTVVKGILANIGAELATKAIEGITNAIGALKDSIVDFSSEYDKTMNKFQAQTGATAEEMERYKDVIENVYGDNFGESLEDVGASVASISQMMPEIAVDDESLKKVTEDAYVLKDTFDFDINESVRSAKMLMDQFGITSDEAFNLMAQGAQNGLNKNGDLMDVINEYSVHYKQMGYSAEEFFNSLANGTEAGAFSVDKVGDAMKEFGIRTKDTSKTTQEAFNALGFAGAVTLDTEEISKTQEEIEKIEKNLKYAKMEQEGFNDKTKELTKVKNADKIADYTEQLEEAKARLEALTTVTETSGTSIEELQAQFFAGGEAAKAATKEIIDRLMNMDDEVQRNAIGVGLFGTMWEDLGPEAILALTNVEGEISSTNDAVSEMSEVLYNDLGSATEGFKRQFQMNVIQPISEDFSPAAMEFITLLGSLFSGEEIDTAAFTEKFNTFINTLVGPDSPLMAFGDKIVELIPALLPAVAEGLSSLLTQGILALVDMLPMILETLLEVLLLIIQELMNNIDTILDAFIGIIDVIADFLVNNIDKIIDAGVQLLLGLVEAIPQIIQVLIPKIPLIIFSIVGALLEGIPQIIDAGVQLIASLGLGILEAAAMAIVSVVGVLMQIVDAISGWVEDFLQAGLDLFVALGEGIASAWPAIKEKAGEIWQGIKDFFADLPEKLKEIGKNIIGGLVEGITGKFNDVKESITGLGDKIGGWFKDKLDINSPSKVFENLASYIPDGIAVGINGNTKGIKNAMSGLSDLVVGGFDTSGLNNTINTMRQNMSGEIIGLNNGSSASNNSNNINVVQNFKYNKPLNAQELRRQTKNALESTVGIKGVVSYA